MASNSNEDDNNDDESTSTVNTDDSEFSEFITSQWKDSVEIGLVITYPLPSTEYLLECEGIDVVGDSCEVDSDDCGVSSEQQQIELTPTTNSLPPLTLSTSLGENSIAPLFDGTQWAGTRVWKAAVLGLEYLVRERKKRQQQIKPGAKQHRSFSSLLELGCGLGVPGMVWKQLLDFEHSQQQQQQQQQPSKSSRRRVVLTDRESLVSQLRENVGANFADDSIEARALDWSREGIAELLRHERDLLAASSANANANATGPEPEPPVPFDVCLNCDCVYEPLYGREAWESLADVLIELAVQSPETLLVTALERRNKDNVEGFLEKLTASGTVAPIERVVRHDADPHHVIEIYVTTGIKGR
ncbi:unnamed protein product [Pseudo-nitzschia multistriata]|uniref:Uncharacterized protein n=1 Tax=Pseudo-nitzschia multistriata TaxID=183589 RepID=A0A448ZDH9_9STRA|nr:unnamed protein product [Pseudo-nitzschia multistriata]